MPTYLQHLALIAFKVGCHVKCSMRCLKAALTIKHLPSPIAFAVADNLPFQVPRICFDTDSFVIGINTYTSADLEIEHPRFRALGRALQRAGLGQNFFAALAALRSNGTLDLGRPSKIFSRPRYLI
jgi:hypothetical protein